jgi:hypothetical protein
MQLGNDILHSQLHTTLLLLNCSHPPHHVIAIELETTIATGNLTKTATVKSEAPCKNDLRSWLLRLSNRFTMETVQYLVSASQAIDV